MSENLKLLFIKKGTFKSALFSKKNASEFSFFSDRIMVRPMGWNRFFNSAEIFIFKEDIIKITNGFSIIGSTFIIETKRGRYWLIFLGDKLRLTQIFYEYYMPI